MRRLYLLRHAKSSWGDAGLDDFDRPLDERGERAAAAMAVYCRQIGLAPARVVCSPAARTRATWTRLAAEGPGLPEAEFDRRIYEAGRGQLLQVIGETADAASAILLVGHNPGMQGVVTHLSGARIEKYPTGALAVLELAGGWSGIAPGSATLVELTAPKALV